MIGARHFDWNPHRELLVLVLWSLFVLLHQESTTCLQYRPVWLHLSPYFESTVSLDKAECRIELKVRFEVLGERQLDLHCVGTPIVKDDFLAVELLVDQHVQVVLLFLHVDGHIHAGSIDCDRDRLRVVLVLEEKGEVLTHCCQLHWNKSELDLRAGVTADLSSALEADLGEEFIKDVSLGWLVVIILNCSIESVHDGDRAVHVGSALLADSFK